MPKHNVQIVQELLAGATDPVVVHALVAPDADYMSLTYDHPNLQRIMPFAGMHRGGGPAAVLNTFQTVHRYWTVDRFEPQQILADGDQVAVFGSFTLTSKTQGKTFTSPFAILATVRNGRVTYMQYLEDTLGTGGTLRSGGLAKYRSNPAGDEIEF